MIFCILLASTLLAAGTGDDVDALLAGLKSPNPGTRGMAAMDIGELGPRAKKAVPALAEALADRDLNVRYWAATALRQIGPDAKAAVPALIAALETFPGGTPPLEGPNRYYPDVRSVSAQALGAIGAGAEPAIPALEKALKDPDTSVQAAAAEALKRIRAK
jgi:HEAT repeat protein